MATEAINKKKKPFRIFFLVDDEHRTVHIEEAEEIDFRMIKRRLERGEEVFITRKTGREIPEKSRRVEPTAGATEWLTSKNATGVRQGPQRAST